MYILIKKGTCIIKTHKSTIHLILTNKPLSFQSSSVIETDLSDHYKLIATFVKSHLLDLTQKLFATETLKNTFKNSFLNDLRETNFDLSTNDPDENHFIADTFIKVVKYHAPLKKRCQAPFMNKELKKAIYTRSRLRNNFCKNPTKENEKSAKHNETNVCLLVRKKLRNILRIFSKIMLLQIKLFGA